MALPRSRSPAHQLNYTREDRVGTWAAKSYFSQQDWESSGEILSLAHSYFDIKMKSTLAVFLEEADLLLCKSFTQVAR